VRGVREGNILAWRGLPYAAPPNGDLRFRAPQPVVPWVGVRDGSRYGEVAPQAYRGQFKGVASGVPSSENCLTLNVVASAEANPTTDQARHGLPVMVFIHGGGYSTGSSRDFAGQGESFVRSGRVLYVSINYRLGALGYLDFTRYSSSSRTIDGNLGLRDQVAALDWVHTNIRAFGGDPDRVTIFGESAGGNAVTTLMATPAARGLFARAIAQSAPSNAVYSREIAARWAGEFVDILRGIMVDNTARRTDRPLTADRSAELPAADLITRASAADLVAASLTLQTRTPGTYPGMFPLAPVIDGDFLPERPLDAFRAGSAHRVPLIIGTNDREGSIFQGRLDILPRSADRMRALFQNAPNHARKSMRDAYPGLPRGRPAADFGGDYAFWYPSVKIAEYHSRFAPVHLYRFDLAPRLMRLVGLDATHGIEMFALFQPRRTPMLWGMTALGGREPFSHAGDRMRAHWLEFACTGSVATAWPQYTEEHRLTLIIDNVDRVESDPRGHRRVVWDEFLPAA
jgi:para-nitrobenzyl esterase